MTLFGYTKTVKKRSSFTKQFLVTATNFYTPERDWGVNCLIIEFEVISDLVITL